MKSPFRKVSRVRTLAGGTTWYLSQDCLLAAKRVMYAVEYRRFYLRDLESIAVWPTSAWMVELIVPGILVGGLAALFWGLGMPSVAGVAAVLDVAWVGLILTLGPTAKARITTSGAVVDMRLVARVRRARKVLDQIDAAVRSARADLNPAVSAGAAQVTPAASAEISVSGAIAAASETNAS